ncbi:Bug family tripartite tricarboxylate transporter substrate binding protein [Rubritepida flocculans]|uniref:Bug family tripartite tricarboxylate transporter substrate binding protein n=1 Tax=Rubritepida flocculans TaxID=182403 RepID=UPI00041A579B|nr:tripartite tricarboxylate transporter substrate binding protein [Rubritepida flocculans]
MTRIPRRAFGAGLAALPLPALAQAWQPGRNVTIIVPFAPGGSTDVVTRLMSERMGQVLGRPVQVENRPGGNTIVGAEAVARAQPDGHTLLMAAGTTLTVNPVIHRNLSYRIEDFAPVTLVSTFPFAVIARNDGPRDIAELVAAARARPGRITYGTNGPTTLTNVAMLMVLERLGITMQDVTYRGDAAQLNDFLAGTLDTLVVAGSTALPVHRNGQGRILGWTSAERVPSTPDVPTFAERAAPGLVAESWFGLLAPARTPPAAVRALHAAAVEALGEPRVRERLTNEAQFLKASTPEAFADFLQEQIRIWRPVLSRLEVPLN